jgi:hypothetical protein
MKAFIVQMENRPGELAKVAEAIAEKGINITGGAGLAIDGKGAFALTSNDEEGTRSALDRIGCNYQDIELVPVQVADQPGELARIARKAADAGVNIRLVLPTGMSTVALGADDAQKLREAVGEQMAATR